MLSTSGSIDGLKSLEVENNTVANKKQEKKKVGKWDVKTNDKLPRSMPETKRTQRSEICGENKKKKHELKIRDSPLMYST